MTAFHFWLTLNKHKKSMGNCISMISKHRLLAIEEFMKNKTFFEKGRIRPGPDRLVGGAYTKIHSIKGVPKKEMFAS